MKGKIVIGVIKNKELRKRNEFHFNIQRSNKSGIFKNEKKYDRKKFKKEDQKIRKEG